MLKRAADTDFSGTQLEIDLLKNLDVRSAL